MPPPRNQGLLAEIPPGVLYYGSIWVLVADGIFAGMAAFARTHDVWISLALAAAVIAILCASTLWQATSIGMSLVTAVVFGILIYRISSILLLAVIVLIQIGLMHGVAFAILRSHWNRAHPLSS